MDLKKSVINTPPPTTANKINTAIQTTGSNIGNTASFLKDSVQKGLTQFSDPKMVMTSNKEFLTLNTLVAKIAITILVLIIFVFLMFLGINIIGYWNQPPVNPYVVYGMIYGSSSLVLSGQQIERSNNKPYGMEFTWSCWLQLTDIPNKTYKYQHIFNKGTGVYDQEPIYDADGTLLYPMGSGLATINNGPGLYLTRTENTSTQVSLHVVMDTVNPIMDPIVLDVSDLPLNKKWFHVAIRLENTVLDVYVNGTISGRIAMSDVPKQNYGDIYVCQNGGFSGFLSNLQYFSRALNASEINQIVVGGPTTKQSNLASVSIDTPYYLSPQWYFSKLNA